MRNSHLAQNLSHEIVLFIFYDAGIKCDLDISGLFQHCPPQFNFYYHHYSSLSSIRLPPSFLSNEIKGKDREKSIVRLMDLPLKPERKRVCSYMCGLPPQPAAINTVHEYTCERRKGQRTHDPRLPPPAGLHRTSTCLLICDRALKTVSC